MALRRYKEISCGTFELFAQGDQTRLKLMHTGIETFPLSNPDFVKENFTKGWTYIIHPALKYFFETMIS